MITLCIFQCFMRIFSVINKLKAHTQAVSKINHKDASWIDRFWMVMCVISCIIVIGSQKEHSIL